MQKDIENLLQPLGINALTPIQEASLDAYANYQEVILYAPTGTGKTLAFLLPLIQLLRATKKSTGVRALILSPTRELATQIEKVFKSLKTELSITACYGGHSLASETNNLSANPDVVVGTPGRLVDHIERENLNVRNMQFLVVDEFDKCLELGFHDAIANIYGDMGKLEKLFFGSATKLNQFPVFIRLTNSIIIDKTDQEVQPKISLFGINTIDDKLTTLQYLIAQFQNERGIIFCNFREDVDQIAAFLREKNIAHAAYHGGLEQDERERALIKFRNNTAPILVCTDIGARGLDIPEVKHIVHYMLPDKEDAFIHRNGRTARMMENGSVYLFQMDAKRAKFDVPDFTMFAIDRQAKYVHPNWVTLYFSGGKKNKINKIDLFGFLCKQGELTKDQVGVIAVLDYTSYVSVNTKNSRGLLTKLREAKVKGQRLKIDVAY
jgi:superfamily II DNA/RNA helicase